MFDPENLIPVYFWYENVDHFSVCSSNLEMKPIIINQIPGMIKNQNRFAKLNNAHKNAGIGIREIIRRNSLVSGSLPIQ